MVEGEGAKCVKLGLIHPPDIVPEDLLNFIELRTFSRDWKKLGLEDVDRDALSLLVMIAPKEPPIVPGTGGLRKMRFVPPGMKVGKSHGFRVCYAYFEEYATVVFVRAYAKNQQDDLSQAERNDIKVILHEVETILDQKGAQG